MAERLTVEQSNKLAEVFRANPFVALTSADLSKATGADSRKAIHWCATRLAANPEESWNRHRDITQHLRRVKRGVYMFDPGAEKSNGSVEPVVVVAQHTCLLYEAVYEIDEARTLLKCEDGGLYVATLKKVDL